MIGWTVIHRGPIVFLLTRPQTLHPSSGLRSTYCVPGTGWNYPTMHPLPGLSCYLLRGRQLELPLICTHLPGFISTYCVPSTSRNYPCLCINLQELRSTYCVPSTGWNYPQLCTHLQDSELPTVCPAVTGITPNSAPQPRLRTQKLPTVCLALAGIIPGKRRCWDSSCELYFPGTC